MTNRCAYFRCVFLVCHWCPSEHAHMNTHIASHAHTYASFVSVSVCSCSHVGPGGNSSLPCRRHHTAAHTPRTYNYTLHENHHTPHTSLTKHTPEHATTRAQGLCEETREVHCTAVQTFRFIVCLSRCFSLMRVLFSSSRPRLLALRLPKKFERSCCDARTLQLHRHQSMLLWSQP